MPTFPQGTTAVLDAFFVDGTGAAVNPVNPRVDVIDPSLTTVVTDGVPTQLGVGHFAFSYPLAGNAPLGSWTAHWDGTINGVPVQADEVFVVVEAGSIGFAVTGASEAGPCSDWDPILCCDLAGVSPAVTGQAVAAGTEFLWAKSGRQFGTCTLTVRPCRQSCGDAGGWWDGGYHPQAYLHDGDWYNVGCGDCADGCRCTTAQTALLPAPVQSIENVTVDGATVPASAYRVVNRHRLERVDGGTWPLCNDGGWTVTLTVGQEVPTLGAMAVGEWVCEYAKACAGEQCGFPRQVAELIRQGVVIRFQDFDRLLDRGLTGMPRTDDFLQAFNPYGLQEAPSVWSPDVPPHPDQVTWP